MVRVWLISDTHFGHENLYHFVTYDGVTRVRPQFQHANEADEFMFDKWNELVRPEDHIYHLGDVAMNIAPYVHRIHSLPGHKRLILGNHDKGKTQEYIACGFEKIMASRFWDRKIAILTHIPIYPDGIRKGGINIHGHIHERLLNGPYRNVCVEHTGYAPIQLEEILSALDE